MIMDKLKKDTSLIVGQESEKKFFDHFFKEVYMVNNNDRILSLYQKHNISVLFLDFDKPNTLEIIKKIRKKDREVVISLLLTDISKEKLQELLPLHLSGCLKKPLTQHSFEKLFYEHILVDLNISKKNIIKIKPNYIFDIEEYLLYNHHASEIKLTKHELKLISLLSLSKNNFLTTEVLECLIWEKESSFCDCNNRLKYLINSTRKKLSKASIINIYGTGYKLICEAC